MIGNQGRIDLLEPGTTFGFFHSVTNADDGFCQHRRLGDTTGGNVIRRLGVTPAAPDITVTAVFAFADEHHVGHHTVMPLATEDTQYLSFSPVDVEMTQAN